MLEHLAFLFLIKTNTYEAIRFNNLKIPECTYIKTTDRKDKVPFDFFKRENRLPGTIGVSINSGAVGKPGELGMIKGEPGPIGTKGD